MRSTRSLVAAILAIIALANAGAAGKKEQAPAGKPSVAVSIIPQVYFVDRISGGKVSAFALVGPGQSPHSYEPTPKQMTQLAAAAAWMSIGVDFEKGLKPKIASLYPKLPIVETNKDIEYRKLEAHSHDDEHEDEHEAADKHDHFDAPGSPDQHVWLGRKAAKAMAASIRDALTGIDSAAAAEFRANHDAFVKDIDRAFDSLKGDLAPLRGKPVFVYHPSFGYFFDEFGIIQEAVETGGKEPTQKSLAELIKKARAEATKAIFVQAQFPTTAAKTIADAVGAEVVPIDPLAPDWLANIGRIGEALKRAARK